MSVAIQQADGDYAAIVVSGANLDLDEAQVAGHAVMPSATAACWSCRTRSPRRPTGPPP